MINDNSTGYWDYSNEIAPQWIEYGAPGARSAPGTINVGGTGSSPSITGAGGAPIGGANPIFSVGPPNPNPNPNPTQQFTPNPFMTPGMTFQPRMQFGQQASAPLNLSQQGRMYGQMPGGPNMAQQVPAFQPVRPGGSMPQFQNPYGPQTQQPQQYRPMGQQPTQISQQPLQQAGLPALMREYRPGDNLVMSSNGVRIP
jgi:hypothetical protein